MSLEPTPAPDPGDVTAPAARPGLPDRAGPPHRRERPRGRPGDLGRRARLGLLVGAFAGAATTGVVVGFGLRAGSALRPFAALGRELLGMDAAHTGLRRALATGTGLLLHLAVTVGWGVLFALVAARWRGWRLWAAAAAVSALAYLTDRLLAPEVWRLSDAPGGSPLQRATIYAALFVALVVGTRVALSSSRPE